MFTKLLELKFCAVKSGHVSVLHVAQGNTVMIVIEPSVWCSCVWCSSKMLESL